MEMVRRESRCTKILLVVLCWGCAKCAMVEPERNGLEEGASESIGVTTHYQACSANATFGALECSDSIADQAALGGEHWPVDAVCGDGMTTHLEECDDENTQNGDGCSASCELEVLVEADEEANGALGGALDLGTYPLAAGVIEGPSDIDFWRVQIWETSTVMVDVSGGVAGGSCNEIRIEDREGLEFAPTLELVLPNGETYYEFDSNCGLSSSEQQFFDLEVELVAGTYYLLVGGQEVGVPQLHGYRADYIVELRIEG